ncbi:MAG: type II toxin-antitoxin system mRNA interferase toxin, RelE/StbE family [Candidatus Micrarchaeaceae archaeon]|jgi:mRNA interferase RelE/StbE/toxin YoeB|nr:type II toxin-antitoxin system mRNA interferase toxin, RelE/StbE family [Candidatus Micrarchaeota archaeon]HII09943.1 type II toxin-antitoxin system mRNA interferase toxin, RelE/StbE family [Candidatus Micrarchaeota archaeon]
MVPYSLYTKDEVKKIFWKLRHKNPKQLQIIRNKIKQILEDPDRFKPLRSDMWGVRAVHIDRHFVLVYSINKEKQMVIIEDYDHHEAIFGK